MMVKRKATASTTTYSKTPRIVLAPLNTFTPAGAQTTADVQRSGAVSSRTWPMPPTPPRPHPNYVPVTTPVKRIQLSKNVSLLLDVKKEVDPPKTLGLTPTPFIPVFRSQFHLLETLELPSSPNPKLKPVFSWTTEYPVSPSVASNSDDEVETVSDVESASFSGVNDQEMKKSESVEQAVNDSEVKTSTDEETHTDDKQRNEAVQEVGVKVDEPTAEAGQLTQERSGAEEARESGEHPAETASDNLSG